MGRILGIDYGTKRTGLAATDVLRIAVHGITTLATDDLWQWLEDYLKTEEVDEIVFGRPTHADGTEVSFQPQIVGLERKIRKHFPQISIVHHDESFTSVRAKDVIVRSGLKKDRRKDKSLTDKVAAILILQDYLGHY